MNFQLKILILCITFAIHKSIAQCPINSVNLSLNPNKLVYCPDDNITVTLNTSNQIITLNWNFTGQNAGTSNSGPTVFNIQKIGTTGNLNITGMTQFGGSNCPVNLSVQIKVNVPLIVNAGIDAMIGGSLTQANLGGSPTASGGSSPYTYAWVPALPTVANPAASPASTTNYVLTVSDQVGCTAQDNVTVYKISSITTNKHYAVLKKKLDSGYYNTVKNGNTKYFYFKFEEEYYVPSTTNLNYKIYNDAGTLVTATPVMALIKTIGDNRFSLNVNSLTTGAYYKIYVYNQKNEVWQGRIKIN